MFTDKAIKALRPLTNGQPKRVFEKGSDTGFNIQVSKGSKSFCLRYTCPITGKRRFLTLGTYPDTPLSEARKRCRSAKAEIQGGADPAEEQIRRASEEALALQEAAQLAKLQEATGTVAQLFEAYVARLRSEAKGSADEVARTFSKDIGPFIGSLKARDVTTKQLTPLVKKVIDRGALVQARNVRTYLMAAYGQLI